MGKKKHRKTSPGDLATNRKARFLYHIEERLECGLQLTGTEVKSLREGGGNFTDAYVTVESGEAWMESFHIRHYSNAAPAFQHDPTRRRRLLLHRKEIDRLAAQVKQKGLTLIPLRVSPRGRWLKVEVGVARGKRLYDKRQAVKERIMKRELARTLKEDHR